MRKIIKGVGLLLLVIITASCATTQPYEVNWPEAQSTLGGKKAVILNYGMAERTQAKVGAAPVVASVLTLPIGGIFYILPAYILSAVQFNTQSRHVKAEVDALQNEQKPILTKLLTDAYKATFNAETVNVDFPFDNTKITLSYFLKPTSQTKESIASIASSNGAEFVIASISQIITGGRGDAWRRKTDITTRIVIFDSAGNLVASGITHTPNGLVSINAQAANNNALGQVEDLRKLFAVSGQNTSNLIRSLR